MRVRSLMVFVLSIALLAGCAERVEQSPATAVRSAPPESDPFPPDPGIEITPAAEAALQGRVRQHRLRPGEWMLRVTCRAGGCTGLLKNLDIETNPPEPTDATARTGPVICVYVRDHFPVIQGARIDYGTEDGQQGFIVTFPNKTPGNQALTAEWIAAGLWKQGVVVDQPAVVITATDRD